jgi:hypothetical protein
MIMVYNNGQSTGWVETNPGINGIIYQPANDFLLFAGYLGLAMHLAIWAKQCHKPSIWMVYRTHLLILKW